jgi:predicted nucleotidyltransferase
MGVGPFLQTVTQRTMELSQAEQGILKELVEAFRRDFGAVEVILYGSAARGQLEEGSDIDLLVVLPEVNWEIEKRLIDYCFQAELKCGRVISTVCFSQEELAQTPLRVSPLVLHARKEGIRL